MDKKLIKAIKALQRGGNINNLNEEQTKPVLEDKEWLNNWLNSRKINDQPIPQDFRKPTTDKVYVDELRPNEYGYFDTKNENVVLDSVKFGKKKNIGTHEMTHQIQEKNPYFNDLIKNPIIKLIKPKSYTSQPEEIHSELMRLRQAEGYKPDIPVTIDQVKSIKDLEGYNLQDLDENQLLELLNSTVSNFKDSNNNYAQQGGKWGIPQYSTQQDNPEYQEQMKNTFTPQNNPYGLPQVSQNLPYPSFFDQNPAHKDYSANYTNMSQEEENLQPNETKKTYTDEYNLINPYGDIGMEQALSFAGRGFGRGDVAEGILGSSLGLIKGTRNFLSAYGAGKSEKEAQESYRANMRDNSQGFQYAQQGGEIENVELLTGEYAQPLPPQASEMANVNVEEDEYIKHGDSGIVQEVPGKKHKDGGEDMALSEGSKVISDYTEIGSANAKHFLNAYGIKLSAKDTFAKALDKYTDKIGLEKLFEEEEEVLKEVEKQTKGKKDKNSQDLNYQFLSEKLQEISEKRKPLEAIRANMFEDVFARQESIPKRGNGELLDDNGKPMKQEGGEMQPQEQPEDQMQQIMQQVTQAIQQGADPNQVVEHLIQMGVTQDEAVALIEQVMAQGQPQEEAMMQIGGMVQQDPMLNKLAKKYGIPADRVQQLLEGGKKDYYQKGGIRTASKFENPELYRKQEATSENWESFGQLLKENPKEALSEIKRVHPELYNTYFKGDKIPDNNKLGQFQNATNEKYTAIEQDYIKKYGENSPQVLQLRDYISKDKFLPVNIENRNGRDVNTEIRGNDTYLGNYTATRPNFTIDVLPKEEYDKVAKEGVGSAWELKQKFPDLYQKYVADKGLTSDFMLAPITEATPEQVPAEKTLTKEEQKVENITRTNNVIFKGQNPFIMPPSSLQPIAKQSVEFGRIDPTKVSIEPNVQEANRQLQASLQNYGNTLSPEVAAAMQAQAVGQSQQAVNQAISQAEVANAGQQFQADQYNLGVDMKETLMNTQLAGQYQDQMMKGLANQEADWRGYFNKLNEIQSLNNLNYNKTVAYNAMNDDYFRDGNGIRFKNTDPNFQNNNQIPAKQEETKKAVKKQQGGILTNAQKKSLGIK